MKTLIKILIAYYIIYLLIGFIIPVNYWDGVPRSSFFINTGYLVLLIIFIAFGFQVMTTKYGYFDKKVKLKPEAYYHSLIRTSIFISVICLILLIFDKVKIQGINFDSGIAVAREQWKSMGAGREGVSSIFSVIGYLFGSTYFWGAYYLLFYYERIQKHKSIYGVIFIVILLMNSVITGGRTIILYFFAFTVSILLLRTIYNKPFIPKNKSLKYFIRIGVVLCMVYVVFIFSQRAAMNDILPRVYAENFAGYLGGKPTQEFYELSEYDNSNTMYFLTVTGLYIYHSLWTTQRVLDDKDRQGKVLFLYFQKLLSKTGLVEDPTYFKYSGRFITVPGALYYDFGFMGLVLGLFLQTYLLVGTYLFLARRSLVSHIVMISTVSFTLLMFFHPATEFLVFPYTITSAFLILAIKKIL